MSPARQVDHPAERYDQSLHYARDKHLPPEAPRPKPTRDWPPENVALLVQYAEYLASGGSSQHVIRTLYIPAAGHVLGLNLKPHPQINLETDLQPALEYIQAKQSERRVVRHESQCSGQVPALSAAHPRPGGSQSQALRTRPAHGRAARLAVGGAGTLPAGLPAQLAACPPG